MNHELLLTLTVSNLTTSMQCIKEIIDSEHYSDAEVVLALTEAHCRCRILLETLDPEFQIRNQLGKYEVN